MFLFIVVNNEVNRIFTNLEGVVEILNEKPEIQDVPTAKNLIIKNGSIFFDKVSFSYDKRRPILNEISFEIPAKKTTAIIGATGSGKSTIANLLFRYYDVSHGRILIDGQDIRELKQLSLQSAIGIVPQNTALFNDTLRYNIAYGHPNASNIEIERAIKNSHLDSFIAMLPEGLDTLVGEQGLKLRFVRDSDEKDRFMYIFSSNFDMFLLRLELQLKFHMQSTRNPN
jgi:ATP-binding cassette, subfamily B, heavy metal transporter